MKIISKRDAKADKASRKRLQSLRNRKENHLTLKWSKGLRKDLTTHGVDKSFLFHDIIQAACEYKKPFNVIDLSKIKVT